MKESNIQRKIIAALRERGAYVFKAVGSPLQQRGTPDLLVCYQGAFIALEIKVPGQQATPLQEYEMKKIRAAGAVAETVTSVEEALICVKRFMKIPDAFLPLPV